MSRKTFLLANLPAALAAAAAFSVFNYALYLLLRMFRPVTLISQQVFPQINGAGVVILQIATYFLLIVAGWLITLAYARANNPVRWLISLAPFVLYGLLQLADAGTGGAVWAAVEQRIVGAVEVKDADLMSIDRDNLAAAGWEVGGAAHDITAFHRIHSPRQALR